MARTKGQSNGEVIRDGNKREAEAEKPDSRLNHPPDINTISSH